MTGSDVISVKMPLCSRLHRWPDWAMDCVPARTPETSSIGLPGCGCFTGVVVTCLFSGTTGIVDVLCRGSQRPAGCPNRREP